MKHLTKGKIILYLAAIFMAGGVTGAVISWREGKATRWDPPTPTKICAFFRTRLQEELGLSAAQVQQLEPLLQKRAKAMAEVHTHAVQQIEDVIRTSDDEIANVLNLTPAQREKFQQMEKNRRARFSGKGHRNGPPPPLKDQLPRP